MAKKIKVSRKKIKKPDEFVTFSDRAFKYISQNKNVAFAVISGIIIALLAFSMINYSLKTRRAKAEALLAEAFSILNTPLAGQLSQEQALQSAKSFASSQERNKQAISKLNEVVQKFGRNQAGMEARYHLGETYFVDGNYQASLSAYEDFLKQLKSAKPAAQFLEYSAYLGIAKDHYQLGNYEKANENFQKVIDQKEGSSYKPEAMLGLARSLIKLKKYDDAREKLEALIQTYPGSIYEQLAKLEQANVPARKK